MTKRQKCFASDKDEDKRCFYGVMKRQRLIIDGVWFHFLHKELGPYSRISFIPITVSIVMLIAANSITLISEHSTTAVVIISVIISDAVIVILMMK